MDEENLSVKRLEKECETLKKEVEFYRNIAEETGKKRLREVEQLNRLIFERKESEKALRKSEQLFRLIAQSTNDIFYELAVEDGSLHWLGDIDSALGYAAGKIKDHLNDWVRVIHPDDRPLFDEFVRLRKESAKPLQCTYRVIGKDDSVRFWRDNSSPVFTDDGKPKKWVGGISDITEQKKAEEALIQAQRLSAIGELASGVAHDFNNSLQGILGNTELGLMEENSPVARHYLETIKKSAMDATSRVRQLQRFSGKGGGQKNYEHIDLNCLVDTVVSQTRSLWKDEAEKAGITITMEKNYTDVNLYLYANAGELGSVLYHLVKNSVQAMPEGGKLIFETGKTGKDVYLIVSDTGIGMEEKTKTRIFQPFFTTKGFAQGRGLGLSTSYAIIKEHKGDIYVKETTVGKGTSIEIKLPFSQREKNGAGDTASIRGVSARVLWVDDEELIRDMGKKMLNKLHHHVDVAADGEEALKLLHMIQYDLLITDVGMPKMNGWQLIERIKGKYPAMKIAVLSGWGDDVSQEEKQKYGVGYVLGKPVLMEQLQHMVAEVLQFKEERTR